MRGGGILGESNVFMSLDIVTYHLYCFTHIYTMFVSSYWWLDTTLQPMIDATLLALDQAGVNYNYEKFPGGRHNERAWAQRIHRPLLHLYGKLNDDHCI